MILTGMYTLEGPLSAIIRLVFFSFASAPSFLLATIMLLLFFKQLRWFPAFGRLGDPSGDGPTGFYVLEGVITSNPGHSSSSSGMGWGNIDQPRSWQRISLR